MAQRTARPPMADATPMMTFLCDDELLEHSVKFHHGLSGSHGSTYLEVAFWFIPDCKLPDMLDGDAAGFMMDGTSVTTVSVRVGTASKVVGDEGD